MFFWKIDDETIRCLIHKEEIDNMGFDLYAISNDNEQMEEFLDAIVKSSRNYIDWHTENGIQNYIAKSLPADQLLITISCTFPDVAIDRDLDQIKKMTSALNQKITDDRLEQIYALSGEEKAKAFDEMSRDLQNVCMGNIEEEGKEQQRRSHNPVDIEKHPTRERNVDLPPRKLSFYHLAELIQFCSMLNSQMHLPSSLYKAEEKYTLFVDFSACDSDAQAVAFMLAAEEYGGKGGEVGYEEAYLMEHGQEMIPEDAIAVLGSMC
ncbi:MAG: adaptor protein MecA [Eubacteriales bacterium]|nr:adaptor protein MecA [Eubacteriales bacterium]